MTLTSVYIRIIIYLRGDIVEKKGVIYKIENLVNGKVYIGQTRVGYKKRTNEHLYSLRKNIHNNDYLQRAWNKYGEESFSFSIVETCDINELDDKETNWISHFRNSVGSYNLESGGNKNKTHCDESKIKMSKASKKKWNNPEYANPLRKKMKEVHGGKNNINAKKVICINTNEVFETMTEAANKYSLNMKNISQVCAGEKATTRGLQFAYYEENKEYKLKEINPKTKGNHPCARKIICINNGVVFDSVISASEHFNIKYTNLHQVVLGVNTTASGVDGELYQFAYYEEGKEYKLKEVKNIKHPKKVVCVTTNQVFNSTREAALKTSALQSKISMCCNGKRKTAGKLEDGTPLKWRFLDT